MRRAGARFVAADSHERARKGSRDTGMEEPPAGCEGAQTGGAFLPVGRQEEPSRAAVVEAGADDLTQVVDGGGSAQCPTRSPPEVAERPKRGRWTTSNPADRALEHVGVRNTDDPERIADRVRLALRQASQRPEGAHAMRVVEERARARSAATERGHRSNDVAADIDCVYLPALVGRQERERSERRAGARPRTGVELHAGRAADGAIGAGAHGGRDTERISLELLHPRGRPPDEAARRVRRVERATDNDPAVVDVVREALGTPERAEVAHAGSFAPDEGM